MKMKFSKMIASMFIINYNRINIRLLEWSKNIDFSSMTMSKKKLAIEENHGLTEENYFSEESQWIYWGSSQFKNFDNCPAKALAELKGEYKREESQSLLQGKYLDSLFEGDSEEFEQQHKVFKKNGELYSHFEDVKKAYNIILKDAEMYKLCTGIQQKIFTGIIKGVDFKIMIDSLHNNYIVDRKYIKDLSDVWKDGEKVPFWKYWGYDVQAALYQYIYEQNTGKKLPFLLACITKEKTPRKEVFQFSQQTLDSAFNKIVSLIVDFEDIKIGEEEAYGCGECDYCIEKKKIKKGEWVII